MLVVLNAKKNIKLDTPKCTYAIVDVEYEDDVSVKRNKELLKKELARPKQKPDAVRELIK